MHTPHGHRRRIFLFVIAIVVPAVSLIALTLQVSRQERELGRTRTIEQKQRSVAQVRQRLLARLEQIEQRAVDAERSRESDDRGNSIDDDLVVLVASVEDDRLTLPFDNGIRRRFAPVSGGAFELAMQRGERAEFIANQLDSAASAYRAAVSAAREDADVGHARLSLARVHARSGKPVDAEVEFATVLSLGPRVTDEHGVPLALYAAAALLDAGASSSRILARLQAEVDSNEWTAPATLFLLRDLARRVMRDADSTRASTAARLEHQVIERIRRTEQVLALQADFRRLPLATPSADRSAIPTSTWLPYGNEMWLVSLTRATTTAPAVMVAVNAEHVAASLAIGNDATLPFSLSLAGIDGEMLGHEFPGLRVILSDAWSGSAGALLPSWFSPAVVLLALSVTLFGAYLLWRDVRRELKMADLRSQFVSSVSHELRTPLTSIRMFAESLRMGRPAEPSGQAEYLDTIVSESERLTRLLNNVLEFSRLEQVTVAYHKSPISLAEVVTDAARALESPLKQQGFTLRLSTDSALLVNADRDAMQQAVLNLVSNAMKYSGESRAIDVRVCQQNGHAVIEVEDGGVGIAAEEHARIFERYYRAPTPANQLITGTGLGLALVQHVARGHGGHIEVRSAPGKGSTFSMHLPVTPAFGAAS